MYLAIDECFTRHDTGAGHPESPERLSALLGLVDRSGLRDRVTMFEPRPLTREEAHRVHPEDHLELLEQICAEGGGYTTSDTPLSPESFTIAQLAAGTAVEAVDRVLTTDDPLAVGLVRPPGHHALASESMGFCQLNNIALAAAHARAAHGVERVLIVDWDVHHGNGTQAIFYDDPTIVFFSAHRFPFYPGTGADNETGTGDGLGGTFNLPLPFGIERETYRDRFCSMLDDAVRCAKPDLILLSAGFDAHHEDPVGSLSLEEEDFAILTRHLHDVAKTECGGKLVSLLEGGYNIERLVSCVQTHIETLLASEL